MRLTRLRAILLLLLALPTAALGQSAEVTVRENLRATPDGDVVAVVDPGTPLEIVDRREGWLEVRLEGWVWMQSLQVTDRGGYDLVVTAAEGENVRVRPSGAILGRLGRGTLLEELERIPGWIRARRVAWIWEPSVVAGGGPVVVAAPPPARTAAPLAPSPAPAPSVAGFRSAGSAGAVILAGPDGDTLARTSAGTELQVVAREGSWARVRLEGWTWLPADGAAGDEAVLVASPSELAADPDRYRGRVVAWDLQFLSLERAERIRTDFFEGEPFLLTRHASGVYVYVALSPERLAEAQSLTPLERIAVIGRVRAPVSALTGSPIVDLMELERVRARR
jgi:hypothetical protein